jgi:hypothetical protein
MNTEFKKLLSALKALLPKDTFSRTLSIMGACASILCLCYYVGKEVGQIAQMIFK